MAQFTLSDVEQSNLEKFKLYVLDKHKEYFEDKHLDIVFVLHSNGIGFEIAVKEQHTGETRDITDVSCW